MAAATEEAGEASSVALAAEVAAGRGGGGPWRTRLETAKEALAAKKALEEEERAAAEAARAAETARIEAEKAAAEEAERLAAEEAAAKARLRVKGEDASPLSSHRVVSGRCRRSRLRPRPPRQRRRG